MKTSVVIGRVKSAIKKTNNKKNPAIKTTKRQ
jgi:hypothetical protein